MKNSKGAIVIEFALILPIMLLLCFGSYEVYRWYYAHTVTQEIAIRVGTWCSLDASQTSDYINKAFNLADDISLSTNGSILVTGLTTGNANSTGNNIIEWTRGSGTTSITSSNPSLSDTSKFLLNYKTIVIEVTYNYSPIVSLNIFTPAQFKKTFCIDYRGSPSNFTPTS